MSKSEKKVLFKSYVDTLDSICDKKDRIEKMQYNNASKEDIELQRDGLERISCFADGLFRAITILNLDEEFYRMNWF